MIIPKEWDVRRDAKKYNKFPQLKSPQFFELSTDWKSVANQLVSLNPINGQATNTAANCTKTILKTTLELRCVLPTEGQLTIDDFLVAESFQCC